MLDDTFIKVAGVTSGNTTKVRRLHLYSVIVKMFESGPED